jgi:aspartyl-tRNA(Asn)/glutamyl-tRNA(Gln) amidotransferase subunit A
MTITEAGRRLRANQVSCLELMDEALESAQRSADCNAFITITADAARHNARALDRDLREGRDRGPLHGIPIAYKDLYYTRGVRTTNGSKLFADFVPAFDATVVEKLSAAGAISIGKLNQHELAYGITSSNPHFGPVRNPHNRDCIPGGSSGGSGAAVASGTVFCGMGSDTGGSIRIPASYCGTVGFKPTFGRVSRYGCFPLGLSLDHMGPLTRSVEDAAVVLNAIAGPDPHDDTTQSRAAEDFRPDRPAELRGLRIGIARNFYNERVHEDVASAFNRAVQAALDRGAHVVEVTVPAPHDLVTVARTVLLAEAAAVLTPYLERRVDFGMDVLALMDQGRLLPATDYVNAQRVRRTLMRDYAGLFRGIDVLFTPTTPVPAPRIGETTVTIGGAQEDARLASTRFVRGINALGLPAISIPCGESRDGLPLGLQIVGRAWADRQVLTVAAAMGA